MKRLYFTLLISLVTAANVCAEGVYFSRIWTSTPDELRNIPATVASKSEDVGAGTCGSFFVRYKYANGVQNARGLYVYATTGNTDGTYTGHLLQFSPNNGSYISQTAVWENAQDNYQWCDYPGDSFDDLYFFNYEGYSTGKVHAKYKKFEDTGEPVEVTGDGQLFGNTSQISYYYLPTWDVSRLILSIKTQNESGDYISPILYRNGLTITGSPHISTATVEQSSIAPTESHSIAIPISNGDALILRQNTDLSSMFWNGGHLFSTINIDYNGVENGLATLGGTTFAHNGKYYYVAGCGANYTQEGKRTLHRGACAVYELSPSNIGSWNLLTQQITSAKAVATYGGNIANTDTENSRENASEDVTFRAIDKGDYVLIYAFSPCNGLACYYFSTKHGFPYTVRFNNAADGEGSMPDQTLYSNEPAALNDCQLKREFNVTYHYQNRLFTDQTDVVSSQFLGWEDHSAITYWINTTHTIVKKWKYTDFDAPYYAAQQTQAVFDKTALLEEYLTSGTGNITGSDPGLYPDGATVSNLATEMNGVVPLYARWEKDKQITLPTPYHPAYTFLGWYDEPEGGNKIGNGGEELTISKDTELFAHWELAANAGEEDFIDRLITWSPNSVSFDLNGYYYCFEGSTIKNYPANKGIREWQINDIVATETINTTPYPTRHNDKTFTIEKPAAVDFTAGDYVRIALYHSLNGVRTLVAARSFRVPVIDTNPQTDNDLYVRGALTITGNATAKNVYIEPSATLCIATGATLSITDTLYIRSRGTAVGQLINRGNLSVGEDRCFYTRQMAQKNVGEPLAMPFACTLPKNKDNVAFVPLKTRLEAETGKASDNYVVIYKYDGNIRAEQGGDAIVWDKVLGPDITIRAIDGYEIMSGSPYYREYLFPMTYSGTSTTTRELEAYRCPYTAFNNIGWNFFCTPYTSFYTGGFELSGPATQTYSFITMYNADGSFNQTVSMEASIPPFTPYYVQVNEDAVLTYQAGVPMQVRAANDKGQTDDTSWAGVVLSDGEQNDKTALVINNSYTDEYEIGADLEKWFAATTVMRPQVYISTSTGKRAFDALSETAAAMPIQIGYIASQEGELTFSLNKALPLNKVTHLYLTDHEAGITTDLTETDYTFETTAGTNETRFTLSADYRKEVPTETDVPNEQPIVRKLLHGGTLYIVVNGAIYDVLGRMK